MTGTVPEAISARAALAGVPDAKRLTSLVEVACFRGLPTWRCGPIRTGASALGRIGASGGTAVAELRHPAYRSGLVTPGASPPPPPPP
ncbi:hypothetical protein AB0D14_14885 [Streptomyces sp. NPDC048484]|uniref:hypothetical protein n=1 Tax=Streptomyces sp. NPDC048484 TaxID=3155146 RepID=UPI00341DEFF5